MYTSLEYVEANGRVRYRRFLTRTLEIYAGLTVASVGLHLFTGRFMKLLSPMRKKTSRLRSVQICGFSNGLLSRPESSRILAQRSDFGKNYIISLFANLQEAWEGEARVTREIVWCDHWRIFMTSACVAQLLRNLEFWDQTISFTADFHRKMDLYTVHSCENQHIQLMRNLHTSRYDETHENLPSTDWKCILTKKWDGYLMGNGS